MPSTAVLAPVTGKIGEVKVTDGQTVASGDIIFVEHAAKTENNVTAPASGRIKLLVQKGSQVNEGEQVAEIQS